MPARCEATNARGEPCGMAPLQGTSQCWAHNPSRGEARALARKRGGRNRRVALAIDPPTDAPRLRDVGAIQRQLEDAVYNTLRLANSPTRSRTIGYLLGFALRALEVGELEARLGALESQLPSPSPWRTA
ncbi:MAG: hypothetical protein H0T86_08285 [Gemmatimonadales bacterium]|nr:hypothetical protein [Gemmatimonadales bacterium]